MGFGDTATQVTTTKCQTLCIVEIDQQQLRGINFLINRGCDNDPVILKLSHGQFRWHDSIMRGFDNNNNCLIFALLINKRDAYKIWLQWDFYGSYELIKYLLLFWGTFKYSIYILNRYLQIEFMIILKYQ